MKAEERRKQIYNIIKSNEEISVTSLSCRFNVSPMTIRRDLNALEESMLINRTYGKAHIIDRNRQEFSFEYRKTVNIELKRKIARTALNLLKDTSTLYVDGSSTVTELLKILPNDRTYTIFTNSFEALKILCQRPWIRTFAIGGFLGPDHNTFDDETTINIAKQIFVDAAITSCSCFSVNGVFNDGSTGTQVKRIMINNSARNFLLADHTKSNSQGLYLLNSWDTVHCMVTDCPLDQKCLDAIRSFGADVYW